MSKIAKFAIAPRVSLGKRINESKPFEHQSHEYCFLLILDAIQAVVYQSHGHVMVSPIVLERKMNLRLVRQRIESAAIQTTSDVTTVNVYQNDGAVIMILVSIISKSNHKLHELENRLHINIFLSFLDCTDKSDEANCTMRNCSESEFR